MDTLVDSRDSGEVDGKKAVNGSSTSLHMELKTR